MEVTVIGNRGGVPTPDAACSAYLVRDGATTVLLDCGHNAAPLVAATALDELDAILVSHMHADHCYDLIPLAKMIVLGARHRGTAPRQVPLYLQEGGAGMLRRMVGSLPTAAVVANLVDDAYIPREHPPRDRVEIGDLVIDMVPTRHAHPCSGVRVQGPTGSMAFTGDTGDCPELRELARGVDLFLCESTLTAPDQTGHGHLSAPEAGAAAAEAGAASLVLTHFIQLSADAPAPEGHVAAARATYDGPVTAALPGRTYTIPAPAPLPSASVAG